MTNKNFLSIALFFITFNFILNAQKIINDPTFNPSDIGFNNGDGANKKITATAIQSDGKTIICGNFTSYNGTPINHIARLNTDGSLDLSFTSYLSMNSSDNNIINGIIIQNDGKIVIAGVFGINNNGESRGRFARLNIDGSLDVSFEQSQLTGPGSILCIALQNDGKIIIGGGFETYNGISRAGIARVNVDGSLDTSFNPGIGVTRTGLTTNVSSIALQNDGKIIIGGGFDAFNGIARKLIARLNSDGSIDTSFNSSIVYGDLVKTISLQSDGKIIIGGYFSIFLASGGGYSGITRLNTDGSIDDTFKGTYMGSNALINKIIVQPDNKIIVGQGGSYFPGPPSNNGNIRRLNADGSFDVGFGNLIGNSINSISLQSNGKIIMGGDYTNYKGATKNHIVQLNADGNIDTTFNAGTGVFGTVSEMLLQTDGKLIICGRFFGYNNIVRNHIARLNKDGSLDASFNSGTGTSIASGIRSSGVYALATQSDGKIIIGGDFTSYNGISRNAIARLNTDGSLDLSFDARASQNSLVNEVLIQNDGKILIAGNFNSINGVSRSRIARLNIDGSLDLDFDIGAGVNGWINKIIEQNDNKILIFGGVNTYNNTTINGIARLNSNGSIDPSFSSPIAPINSGTIRLFNSAIQNDGKILICGDFTFINNATTTRNAVARLNNDGSFDPSFTPIENASTSISAIILEGNGKIIIGGGFTSINGVAINSIALLNSDGSLDLNFDPGIGPNKFISSIVKQNDGKLIIGGDFTSYNGIGRNRIARIMEECTHTSSKASSSPKVCINSPIETITHTTTGATGIGNPINLPIGVTATWAANVITINGTPVVEGNYDYSIPLTGGCLTEFATGSISALSSTSGTDVQSACTAFTWIDGNTYSVSNNTATHILVGGNALGCDSIVTLNLTIDTPDISVIQTGNILTANTTGRIYQWLNCDDNNSELLGEIGQSYTPNAIGNYSVIIKQGVCSDTSACYNIITTAVSNPNHHSLFSAYPNPNNGSFEIKTTIEGDYTILNSLGQSIDIVKLSTTETNRIINLESGVYFIVNENGILQQKIVVIK